MGLIVETLTLLCKAFIRNFINELLSFCTFIILLVDSDMPYLNGHEPTPNPLCLKKSQRELRCLM